MTCSVCGRTVLHPSNLARHVASHEPTPFAGRFWDRVIRTDGCWEWKGAHNELGYSLFYLDHRRVRAHRVAYELTVAPIPEGLELDHLCRNRGCVRPDHLEPVTHAENMRRSESASGWNAAKTHCANGHPFSPDNTTVRDGKRECRECRKAANRRHQPAANARRQARKAHTTEPICIGADGAGDGR